MAANARSTVFQAGMEEGRMQVRKAVIEFLEDRYVNAPDRPDRGSPEGKQLLALTTDLVKFVESVELK